MNYKIGQELYSGYACDETGKVEIDVFKVRTIRGGYVYAIRISLYTWGKKSSKSGDYGWLDPISKWNRYKTRIGGKFPTLHTTKRQAYMDIKKEVTENEYKEYPPAIQKKILSTVKRQITKLKTGKKGGK